MLLVLHLCGHLQHLRLPPLLPARIASQLATSHIEPTSAEIQSSPEVQLPLPTSPISLPPTLLDLTQQARIVQGNLLKKLVDGIKDLVRFGSCLGHVSVAHSMQELGAVSQRERIAARCTTLYTSQAKDGCEMGLCHD